VGVSSSSGAGGSDRQGGDDKGKVPEVAFDFPEYYRCVLCGRNPALDPVQLRPCGHTACEMCALTSWDLHLSCPSCNREIRLVSEVLEYLLYFIEQNLTSVEREERHRVRAFNVLLRQERRAHLRGLGRGRKFQ